MVSFYFYIMKEFSVYCKWAECNVLFSLLDSLWRGAGGSWAAAWGSCSSWTRAFASFLHFSGDGQLASDTCVRALSSKQGTSRVGPLSFIHLLSFLGLLVTFWCLSENSVRDSRALAKVEWCWICCRTHLESPEKQCVQGRDWLLSYQNIYELRWTLHFLVKQHRLHFNIWNSFQSFSTVYIFSCTWVLRDYSLKNESSVSQSRKLEKQEGCPTHPDRVQPHSALRSTSCLLLCSGNTPGTAVNGWCQHLRTHRAPARRRANRA